MCYKVINLFYKIISVFMGHQPRPPCLPAADSLAVEMRAGVERTLVYISVGVSRKLVNFTALADSQKARNGLASDGASLTEIVVPLRPQCGMSVGRNVRRTRAGAVCCSSPEVNER